MRAQLVVVIAGVLAAAPGAARADDPVDDNPVESERPFDELRQPCVSSGPDVVGIRRCPRFGTWGTNLLDPYFFVEIGMNYRQFPGHDTPHLSLRSTAPSAGVRGTTVSPDSALVFDERFGFGLTHGFYAAIDLELGNLEDSPPAQDPDFLVDALASLGTRGSLGPFARAGERAGGAMQYSTSNDWTIHNVPMLEARGRLGIWVAPWFTIGGVFGASLIDRGEWMAGVYLGTHTWSFAGDR